MTAIETPVLTAFGISANPSEPVLRLGEPRARILSISSSPFDHLALRSMIDDTRWQLATADTLRQALPKLHPAGTLVVFCDSTLDDGAWKNILERISCLDEPPLLVVTSRLADDLLWSEVLNLGGFDVLLKPFVEDEVRRLLATIWTYRTHPLPKLLPVAHPPAMSAGRHE